MRNPRPLLLLAVLLTVLGFSPACFANVISYALKLDATVVSGTSLRLQWEGEYWSQLGVSTQKLYRRAKGSNIWGTEIASIAAPTFQYTDTVVPGVEYEYQIRQTWAPGNYYTDANAYLSVGINLPAVESRGKILLLVDASKAAALAPEITQLQQDLTGDGWTVLRTDLPRETVDPSVLYTPSVGAARLAEVTAVKNVIKTAYDADPANVKAVYILGHLPVPYSGTSFPDGHADHQGATPADTYYGDMTGTWTDTTVNLPPSANVQNRCANVPGDGKFDQRFIFSDGQPSAAAGGQYAVSVGRVDMAGMTRFPNSSITETELLRRYLRKAHDYRHKKGAYANLERRALLFPWGGEVGGYAHSALNGAFSAVGRAATNYDFATSGGQSWFDFQEANPTKNYMVGVAQGAGNYEGAGSIGSSQDFGNRPSRAVFLSMFGSYFGDIGAPNCFLNAPLAGNARGDSLGLSSAWNGGTWGEAWYFHPMGMGETVAYAAKISVNNKIHETTAGGDPIPNYGVKSSNAGSPIMNLLGDPALRWYHVLPPQNLQAASSGGSVNLSWSASTESNVTGYLVYRGTSVSGPFTKFTPSPITATTFTDSTGTAGTAYTYMVRTQKLDVVPGGSFQNLSQGIFATITANSGGTSIPSAPNGLQVSTINSSTLNLTWTDNASNETGYRVERRSGGAGSFTTVANLAAGATNYTDAGPLTAGTTLYYRVIATGAAGDSLASNVAYVDGLPGFIEMLTKTTRVQKSAGYIDILVQRFGGSTGSASVQYSTTSGSAIAGTHFTAANGTLTWADGETGSKTVRVSLLGLAQPQLPRAFTFSISNVAGASLSGSNLSASVLIEDPSAPLASPWQATVLGAFGGDVGAVGQIGGEIGSTMAGGNEIQGRYIYQQMSGDKSMTVKIEAPSSILGWGGIFSSGIMVREHMNSEYGRRVSLMVGETAGTGVQFASYDSEYDSRPEIFPNFSRFPADPANTLTSPIWVRLTRIADNFVAETSQNGTTWTTFASFPCAGMPANAYWCLFASNPGFNYSRDFQLARFNNISFSTPVLTVPNAPTNLAASNTYLYWQHISGAQSGYKVERRAEGETNWTQIGTTTGLWFYDTPPPSDSGLEYRVRAYNALWNSDYSNVVQAISARAPVESVYTTTAGQGADATIRNGSDANTNFGNSSALYNETSPGLAKSYLRFDLSNRPAGYYVATAALDLYVFDVVDGTHDVVVLPEAADTWNESTLTWNNAPANNTASAGFVGATARLFYTNRGAGILPNGKVDFFSGEFNALFGTSAATDATLGANKLLTLGIVRTSAAKSGFVSGEHPTFSRPKLSLVWSSGLPLKAVFLTGKVTAPGAISLQWLEKAFNETGFRVEVSANGGTSYTPLATTAANVTSLVLTSLPSVAGNHLYRVVAFNATGDATPSLPVTLAPFAGLTSIQAWMLNNNLPMDGTGDGSLTACPAGDGITNLMKYALGINAATSGYQGHMTTGTVNVRGSDYLSLTYTRPEPAPAGVTYVPQSCAALTAWSGAGIVEDSSSVSGGLRTITVRDTTAMGAASQRFLRMIVTAP